MPRDDVAQLAIAEERWVRAREDSEAALAEAEAAGLSEAVESDARAARYAMGLVELARGEDALEHIDDIFSEGMIKILIEDSGDTSAEEILIVALEQNADELYELAERVREIVELGPDGVKRKYELAERVRELANRRMRRWQAKHPEVAPPPEWERGEPGYEEARQRWWAWRQRSDALWHRTRQEVVTDLLRPACAPRRAASRSAPRDRRQRSPRRARAPTRSANGDEPPHDVVGSPRQTASHTGRRSRSSSVSVCPQAGQRSSWRCSGFTPQNRRAVCGR
jgi:hypothetical protein